MKGVKSVLLTYACNNRQNYYSGAMEICNISQFLENNVAYYMFNLELPVKLLRTATIDKNCICCLTGLSEAPSLVLQRQEIFQ